MVPNDNNGSGDVIIYDRAADSNTAASARAAGLASVTPNGHSGGLRASADGRLRCFRERGHESGAEPPDANNASDVFVRDRQTNVTTLVSHAAGAPASAADAISDSPAMSDDGRWITYASQAFVSSRRSDRFERRGRYFSIRSRERHDHTGEPFDSRPRFFGERRFRDTSDQRGWTFRHLLELCGRFDHRSERF